jgi:branched-subunit amino acid aminotransferase/4-amino-4-deoxychorismate lyase
VSANLFFEREGQLLTPELRLPLYPGIVRHRVLAAAEALDLGVREGRFSASDLLGCDAAILTNSVRGVETVASIDGRPLGATPLVDRVSSAVRAAREKDAVPLPGAAT